MSIDAVASDEAVPGGDSERWRPRNVHFGGLLAVSLVVIAVLAGLFWTGALAPRVDREQLDITQKHRRLEVSIRIRNAAAKPVHLTHLSTPVGLGVRSADVHHEGSHGRQLDRSASGVDLQDIALGPNHRLTFHLVYEITDCNAAAVGPRTVDLTARTYTGITREVVVANDLVGFSDASSPSEACSQEGHTTISG